MSASVELVVDSHVATVTLNRPEKLNAMDLSVFEGLIGLGEEIAERDDVRAVVLQGAGRSFCTGIDLQSLMAEGLFMTRAFEVGENSPANFAQRAAVVWQELPQPVIAAVHGQCFGGGLQVALGADIRIGAPDVDMRVLEIKWGLVPDMGISQTALHIISADVLKLLTWTGRAVHAQEALRLGLLTEVHDDPQAAALALATDIATRSPDAVRGTKQLLNVAWRTHLAEAYGLEADIQRAVIGQPNQLEAVMSNFEKRPAKFR